MFLSGMRKSTWTIAAPPFGSLGMLFNDTFLGVGTPEVVVILVVGYFVLGPVELFKFTKQAGVLLGQLKDIGLGTATNLGQILDEQVCRPEILRGLCRPLVRGACGASCVSWEFRCWGCWSRILRFRPSPPFHVFMLSFHPLGSLSCIARMTC